MSYPRSPSFAAVLAAALALFGLAACTPAQAPTGGGGGTGAQTAPSADLDALCAELEAQVAEVSAKADALTAARPEGWGRGWRSELFGCVRGTHSVWALVPTDVVVHGEEEDASYLGAVEVAWEVRYAAADGTRATLARSAYWPDGYCSLPTAELVAVQDLDDDGTEELIYDSNIHCTEGDTEHTVAVLSAGAGGIVPHPLSEQPLFALEDLDGDGRLDAWLGTLSAGHEGCSGMGTWVVTAPLPLHNVGQGRFVADDDVAVAALRARCPSAGLELVALREDFEALVQATACARLHGHTADEVLAELSTLCDESFLDGYCAEACDPDSEYAADCLASCRDLAMCDVGACEAAAALRDIASAEIAPLLATGAQP